MEIIKERKLLKILLILGIVFSALILFNTKTYAAYLSVRYNNTEVATNKYLNLSMKYKYNPITWKIFSADTWKVVSYDNKVINITIDRKNNAIKIAPISPTAQNGRAKIIIYTKGQKILKTYYIQVNDYLSVKNERDQEVSTDNVIEIDYMRKYLPVTWSIYAPNGWHVVSHDNDVISIQQYHYPYSLNPWRNEIDIYPKKKGGTATIHIFTDDGKISRTYRLRIV